jgi:hypothetical protein
MKMKKKNRGYRLATIEKLEQRQLLSGTIVESNTGVVTITGTLGADEISAQTDTNNSNLWDFIIITPGVGTVEQSFTKSSVTSVVVHCDPSSGTPLAGDNDVVNFGGLDFNVSGVGINGGAGNDTIIGSNSPNTIFGNGTASSSDVLYGGTANDTIVGGAGQAIIHGGAGDDVLIAASGATVIQGGAGNDNISSAGDAGNDTLRGGPGDDTVTGGSGNDVLMANDGNDFLTAGTGNTTLIGGSGNDTIQGGQSTGQDSLTSGGGNDFISANSVGFLTLQGVTPPGQSGNSIITGAGSSGNDTIGALFGNDSLYGSTGSDYYAVNDSNAVFENYSSGGIAEADTFNATPTVNISITLTINYVANGVTTPVIIPLGAGASPNNQSAAEALNSSGNIHFLWDAPRVFTLADFFDHWGVPFNSTGVGQFQTGGFGHTFAMTVNGVTNTQYGAYQVQNGDNIVLTFTQ